MYTRVGTFSNTIVSALGEYQWPSVQKSSCTCERTVGVETLKVEECRGVDTSDAGDDVVDAEAVEHTQFVVRYEGERAIARSFHSKGGPSPLCTGTRSAATVLAIEARAALRCRLQTCPHKSVSRSLCCYPYDPVRQSVNMSPVRCVDLEGVARRERERVRG